MDRQWIRRIVEIETKMREQDSRIAELELELVAARRASKAEPSAEDEGAEHVIEV